MSVLTRGIYGIAGPLIDHATAEPVDLNSVIEFDSPFFVLPGDSARCTILTYPHVPDGAPYIGGVMLDPDDGLIIDGADWEPVSGYSGQHGYAGPVMHPSEYLGGGMARDLLSGELGAGWFVIVAIENHACDDFTMHGQCTPDGDDCGRGCTSEPAGWILLHRPVDLEGHA